MDLLTALRRRRRPHDRIFWQQQRRNWYLEDLERITPQEWSRGQATGKPRGLTVWVSAAVAYNNLLSLQDRMISSVRAQINESDHAMARDWPRPDYSYVLPEPQGSPVRWDAVALGGVLLLLLLLALGSLVESCGHHLRPRPSSIKNERESDDPAMNTEPPSLEDLPPPYTDTQEPTNAPSIPTYEQLENTPEQCSTCLQTNYTPIADETPPPAYSEIYVQMPNLKVYYTNERDSNSTSERENNEMNENVANDCVENSGVCDAQCLEVRSEHSSVLV